MGNKIVRKSILGAMALGMTITGAAGVYAGSNLEKITAYLNGGIGIKVNGTTYVPTDANGSKLTPITYRDTTYLPVRALADALHVQLTFDPAANQVLIATTPSQSDNAAATRIVELLRLAREGKAPGIPYVAHDSIIDDVQRDWGEADSTDSAGNGIYAVYSQHRAVFGYNKGSQIFDIRSSDPDLQQLTLSQIEQTLGKPSSTATNGDDTIYVYETGTDFQLKFIIPASTGKVDHISVFSKTGSFNNMAG